MTMKPPVRRIERVTASSAVFEQLKSLIIVGKWRGGCLLPPERELCEMLGTGRTTVREALGALGAIGLVSTRHGKGTYVTVGLLSEGGFDDWDASHASSITELLALRYALEPMIAAVAARKRTDSDIAEAEAALSQMQTGISENDAEAIARGDVRFHCVLASAAGNPIFSRALDSLLYLLIDSCRTSATAYAAGSSALRAHRLVLDAVVAGDSAEAASAMRWHVVRLVELLEQRRLVDREEIDALFGCGLDAARGRDATSGGAHGKGS